MKRQKMAKCYADLLPETTEVSVIVFRFNLDGGFFSLLMEIFVTPTGTLEAVVDSITTTIKELGPKGLIPIIGKNDGSSFRNISGTKKGFPTFFQIHGVVLREINIH